MEWDSVPARFAATGQMGAGEPSGDSTSPYSLLKGSLQWASNVTMAILPKTATAAWKSKARAPSRWQGLLESYGSQDGGYWQQNEQAGGRNRVQRQSHIDVIA